MSTSASSWIPREALRIPFLRSAGVCLPNTVSLRDKIASRKLVVSSEQARRSPRNRRISCRIGSEQLQVRNRQHAIYITEILPHHVMMVCDVSKMHQKPQVTGKPYSSCSDCVCRTRSHQTFKCSHKAPSLLLFVHFDNPPTHFSIRLSCLGMWPCRRVHTVSRCLGGITKIFVSTGHFL